MKHLPIAAILAFAACAPLTPTQQAAGQVSVMVATQVGGTTVTKALAEGQLLCGLEGSIVAIVDGITGQPILVTGKPAQTVANVCGLIGAGAVPVPPPATPVTVPAVAVVTK